MVTAALTPGIRTCAHRPLPATDRRTTVGDRLWSSSAGAAINEVLAPADRPLTGIEVDIRDGSLTRTICWPSSSS
jgi:hypothetical protein